MLHHLYSLVLFLCLFSSSSLAQTTITTWYIIPPTNGCNGIWAVDANTLGGCGNITTYSMSPPGCVQITNNTIADTTYWNLCSFPCNLTMINTNGQMCICGTGTMTGDYAPSAPDVFTSYPTPAQRTENWNIVLTETYEKINVIIHDELGRSVSCVQFSNTSLLQLNISELEAGYYTVSIDTGLDRPGILPLIVK